VLAVLLADFRGLAEEAGVEIEVQEPVPDVLIDAGEVEFVLRNLLEDAIRDADPRRPRRWIRISAHPRGSNRTWWVAVRDNGLGIATEPRKTTFQGAPQAHPDPPRGGGHPLALVARAVERLGSSIEVESEPGTGSVVRFSLPDFAEAAPARGESGARGLQPPPVPVQTLD
jgi:signal transduction histidine kinase